MLFAAPAGTMSSHRRVQRKEDVYRRPAVAIEARRRNADDDESLILDDDLASENRAIAVEPSLPERMAEHDDRVPSGASSSTGPNMRPRLARAPSSEK